MATKLEKILVREVEIDGESFTVAIAPEGIRLSRKRFRSGVTISWKTLWNEGRRGDDEQARPR